MKNETDGLSSLLETGRPVSAILAKRYLVHMAFDGIDREHQFLRNLRIGGTTCDQLEHVQFTFKGIQ